MHEMLNTLAEEWEMNLEEVFRFMDGERLGVLTTATYSGQPQAALMGVVVTPALEMIKEKAPRPGRGRYKA